MKKETDYVKDILEIRSMMERSSKFLSLSGWAGIMAGIYALVVAYVVNTFFKFQPVEIVYTFENMAGILTMAIALLTLSIVTAIFLSYKRATKRAENIWNPTSRRMVVNMSVPLLTGGIFCLILLSKDALGLLPGATLIFYGMALFQAGNYTFREIKALGIIQVGLGLISLIMIPYSVGIWALGFGIFHIGYGIYIHLKHER